MWSPDWIPSAGSCQEPTSVQRPNLVSGVPLWIADPNVAGGKEINPAAFTIPTGAVQGDLGRNALRGFGATKVDLTLRRQFKLRERLSLQARADLFNIFNHPNFGQPDQLSEFSAIRAIDSDAGSIARKRRPEWRPQSALSNRRPALGATGSEARVLSGIPPGENRQSRHISARRRPDMT